MKNCHKCDELAHENMFLKDALEYLVDVQNGPPLCNEAQEWANAMNRSNRALGRNGGWWVVVDGTRAEFIEPEDIQETKPPKQ